MACTKYFDSPNKFLYIRGLMPQLNSARRTSTAIGVTVRGKSDPHISSYSCIKLISFTNDEIHVMTVKGYLSLVIFDMV